ncbi:folate family ECF transporter S component [Enterococcus dongliensis]|uniref:folate family ECF transporter S component n=1 Tax=Enterococcus dongliensis TaxID=2559925 RepID=UPI00288CD9CB|nr:folate family ECF transporter S component [Enterococcus dongliensis]MDT2673132.1 folate family ECF transporter S component [Enterococcus dongliensis]
MKKQLDARSITTMALLIAMMVTLSRILGIETQFLKVSFTFIPEIIMGMLFGPIWTGIGSVIADFIGMSLFAKAPFFIGFTINAFLEGAIYGYFFYKKEITWKNSIQSVLVSTILINLILTPLWLAMMYHVPLNSWVIWIPRLIKTVIWIPIQTAITYFLGGVLPYKQWIARFNRAH